MSQNKKKRKLKKEVVQLITIITIILLAAVGLLIYKSVDRFDYETSLGKTVISITNNTVSGCEVNVTLKDIGYYIATVEAAGQETALIYNKDNPLEYWNVYLNENMTSNSGYVSDIAKRSVITYCVRDNIYNIEARLNGFTVDEETMSDIEADAEYAYTHLTMRAREALYLTPEEYMNLYIKERMAHEYILYLAGEDEADDYEAVVLKYDVDGTYYKDLLNRYEYKVDEKLWENVRIGHITIN